MTCFVMFGNTSQASRARFVEAAAKTNAKIHRVWMPYGLAKGVRIEYLVELENEMALETFKNIAKPGYVETNAVPKLN